MNEWTAYDQLGPRVKKALQSAVTEWDSYWCLRMVRKHGSDWVIKSIRDGDEKFMKKGFVVKRGRGINVPSSYVKCKVQPLQANW
jgi:hypothetical protein